MSNYTGPNTGTPPEGQPQTGSVNLGSLLNYGDLMSALTTSAIEYSLGEKPTGTKAATAVAISSISRIITQNFTTFSSLSGNITDEATKDAFIVALVNGLVAMGQKRSVTKQIAIGVSGDVLGDRALIMMNVDPKKSLFNKKQSIFNLKNKVTYIINYVV